MILAFMLILASSETNSSSETNVQVTLITTAGVIIVAALGILQIKINNKSKKDVDSAKEEAKSNAEEAVLAAQMAKDYAAAMGVKDALVASFEDRVRYLEEQNKKLIERLDEFERRDFEHHEQQRANALIERNYLEELDKLRAELHQLRDHGQ